MTIVEHKIQTASPTARRSKLSLTNYWYMKQFTTNLNILGGTMGSTKLTNPKRIQNSYNPKLSAKLFSSLSILTSHNYLKIPFTSTYFKKNLINPPVHSNLLVLLLASSFIPRLREIVRAFLEKISKKKEIPFH